MEKRSYEKTFGRMAKSPLVRDIHNNLIRIKVQFKIKSVSQSGTSAAAPLVTGIVGLVMKGANPALDPHKMVKALNDAARQVASLTGKIEFGGIVSGNGAVAKLGGLLDQAVPLPTPTYGDSSNGGQGGSSNVPPALRTDDDGRRAHGRDGILSPFELSARLNFLFALPAM